MYKSPTKIAILLASYNGEEYIKEQLDSIIAQTNNDWTLFIRDDGSTDKTIEIINDFAQKDDRVVLVQDGEKHFGCTKSFLSLLEQVDAQIYMYCDQDDYWFSDKIDNTLSFYQEKEKENPDAAIVISTNVMIADRQLKVIYESYWKELHINPKRYNKSYNYFGVNPIAQGSTMLFNNRAKNLCFPLKVYTMHDSYVVERVMLGGGYFFSMMEPTMLYRQHGRNVLGAQMQKVGKTDFFKWVWNKFVMNYRKYKILQEKGYGSFAKYIWYKIKVSFLKKFVD